MTAPRLAVPAAAPALCGRGHWGRAARRWTGARGPGGTWMASAPGYVTTGEAGAITGASGLFRMRWQAATAGQPGRQARPAASPPAVADLPRPAGQPAARAGR